MTDKKKPNIFADFRAQLNEAYEEEKKRRLEEKQKEDEARARGMSFDEYDLALYEARKKQRALKEGKTEETFKVESFDLDKSEKESLLEAIQKLDEIVDEPEDKMGSYIDAIKKAEERKKEQQILPEDANLLGGQDAPVTRADLQKAISTSLASVGGGGYGKEEIIRLILENAPAAGSGGVVDGLDSAAVIALITGTVDSAYVAARDSDLEGDHYKTADHDSDTLVQVDSAYVAARLPDLYDTPDHDSDTLVQVDSAYVRQRQFIYGDRDVRELLEGDSGARNILPALDSTYDLGDSALRWKDIWLSGNTIHLGSRVVKSGGDEGVGLYVDDRRLAYADSIDNLWDSAKTIQFVDSAYINLRSDHWDSAKTIQFVDSTYVTDRVTLPASVDYIGAVDVTTDSTGQFVYDNGDMVINTVGGTAGATWTGIVGDSISENTMLVWDSVGNQWQALGGTVSYSGVDSVQIVGIINDTVDSAFVNLHSDHWDSANTTSLIDSAYINARVDLGIDSVGLDSAQVTALIDSAYVEARVTHYTTANHDSDTLAQVDSAYVNARSDHYTTADHDSDTLVQVDSAYVQARQLSAAALATVDSVAPAGPQEGQLWYDPTQSVLFVRDSGAWDSIGGGSDSGDYLLLTGGTVTGPLNLDSGGIQFGPDSDRNKLYTGFSQFYNSENWSRTEAQTFESVAGDGAVNSLARDAGSNRLVIAKGQAIYISDDSATSWRRATNDSDLGLGGAGITRLNYYPEDDLWMAVKPENGSTHGNFFYSLDGAETWRSAARNGEYLMNTNQIGIFDGDGDIHRGQDDSGNTIFYAGPADASGIYGYYRSLRANAPYIQSQGLDSNPGSYWQFRAAGDNNWPNAPDGLRNDNVFFRSAAGWSSYHNKWLMIAGHNSAFGMTDTTGTRAPAPRVWQSTNGRDWTATSAGGYDISNPTQRTETNPTDTYHVIEDPRTGYMMWYSYRTSNRAHGITVTTDGGTTWFTPKFKVNDPVGARSVIELGTESTHRIIEIQSIDYDTDAGIFYALGRADRKDYIDTGGLGPVIELFSSDLLNWIKGEQIASASATANRRGVVYMGGGEFLRAGTRVSGDGTPDEPFGIGEYGTVTEGIGSLKWNEEVVLTDDNWNRYIPIETETPDAIETGHLLFFPDTEANFNVNGNFGGTFYGRLGSNYHLFGPGKFDGCTIRRLSEGHYRVEFSDWNTGNATTYTVMATIEALNDYTASARTAMIYNKSNEGFEILLERTDNSEKTDEFPSVSLSITSYT